MEIQAGMIHYSEYHGDYLKQMTYNERESRRSQKTRIVRREKTENPIHCFIDPHCSRSDDEEHCNLQVDGE